MAAMFARDYAPSFWDPEGLRGPCHNLTLREWEVSVMLCSLPPAVRQMLSDWLIEPTDARWLRLAPASIKAQDAFARHLAPFAVAELRQPVDTLCALYWAEMQAIRQTLDLPSEALRGITRDTLLAARGARLRQLTGALGQPRALDELARMTQTLPAQPPSAEAVAFLSARWGGRWASFFASALAAG